MKIKLHSLLLLLACFAGVHYAGAQGTLFTYQGRLNLNGSPVTGNLDFRFKLFPDPAGNLPQVGTTFLTNGVSVTGGLFSVGVDFGAGIFTGSNYFLLIGISTNGGVSYSDLSPLQPVTPTPYAIMANGASNLLGSLPTSKLNGTVNNGQLANSSVTVTAGTGLSGGGVVALGGSTSLTNTGVLSVTGNSDITANTTAGAVTLGDTATSAATPNTLVKRDATGSFSATNLTLGGVLTLPAISGASSNLIFSGTSLLLYANSNQNFFSGPGAGNAATTGSGNTAYGPSALQAISGGIFNAADGDDALFDNTTGNNNSAFGNGALFENKTGSANTAVGRNSLLNMQGGSNNIALGFQAGSGFTGNESSNIDIGNIGVVGDTNIIRIGSGQTNTFIAGILSANGGGLSNLNAAQLTGAIQSSQINDGGSSAYQTFQQAVQAVGGDTSLTFSNLFAVAATNGVTPALSLTISGSAFGTVIGFSGCEAMSQPYSYVVEVSNSSSVANLDTELNLPATLTFTRNGLTTTFSGLITDFALASSDGTTFLYTVKIESPLVRLALSKDYKIYQMINAPNVASTVYQATTGAGTPTLSLGSSYSPHDSLTQFAETDLNFFSRILENEGLFYFFNQGTSPPGLIIGDQTTAYLSAPNSPFIYYGNTASNIPAGTEYIRTFQRVSHQSTLKSTVNAYNFETPNTSLSESVLSAAGIGENYEFGNEIASTTYDQQLATLRRDRQNVEHAVISGSATAPDLRAGYTFTLTDQTSSGLGNSYLVASVHHAGFVRVTNGVSTFFYGNEFEVIPASLTFRPAIKTPKPKVHSSTAFVTGNAGDEITTDNFGRVHVQFNWDRYGQNNQLSSAWMRVASPWAGSGRGLIFVPRIGDEVLVSFIDGDPDQPVVTGSLYNANALPPVGGLPANKTRSGILTLSSKGGGGNNELMFDDLKGSELVILQAEKDMTMTVKHDWNLTVDNNLTANVGGQIALNGPVSVTSISGNGGGLTNLTAADLTGPLPAISGASLTSLPANAALLNASQTFTGANIFANNFAVNTGAGTLSFINDQGQAAGIVGAGGPNAGDIRLRNYLQIFPNQAGTVAGELDIRNTTGNGTITETGADGGIVASNLTINNSLVVDSANLNVGLNQGAVNAGLLFGSGSGEGITSIRANGFGDSFGLNFYTDFAKRMTILQNGNVGIGTTNATNLLQVLTAYCNGTTWQNGSDRSSKEDFTAIDPLAVLEKVSALSITEWRYKVDPNGMRHLGPVAQDFHDAFGLNGGDDKHIATIDEEGVALAAIQGLNRKVQEKDAAIQDLNRRLTEELQRRDAENAELKQRLDRLEKLIAVRADKN